MRKGEREKVRKQDLIACYYFFALSLSHSPHSLEQATKIHVSDMWMKFLDNTTQHKKKKRTKE